MKGLSRSTKYYRANRDKVLAQQKAHRAKKVAAGLCSVSACPEKPQGGLKCAKHRDAHAVRQLVDRGAKVTVDDLQNARQQSCGLCSICGLPFSADRPACFDHNHATGAGRGMLCRDCNSAIGLLREDPALFRSAAFYLIQRGARQV